jgi:serine/threonine-protein kinase ATR
MFESAVQKNLGNDETCLTQYKTLLKMYPPVLQHWFYSKSGQFGRGVGIVEPAALLKMRTNFTKTQAIWCMLGYIVGLGDRHLENLLLDTMTGETVHVDFECLLGKGMFLARSEVVPFRLTQNILAAMGPVGAEGLFRSTCVRALALFKLHSDEILSSLGTMITDPLIDWINNGNKENLHPSPFDLQHAVGTAREAVKLVRKKLVNGLVNVANPSMVPCPLLRFNEVGPIQVSRGQARLLNLSVEEQVGALILSASNDYNLARMWIGWAPAM